MGVFFIFNIFLMALVVVLVLLLDPQLTLDSIVLAHDAQMLCTEVGVFWIVAVPFAE
jgi:hypothetical protein